MIRNAIAFVRAFAAGLRPADPPAPSSETESLAERLRPRVDPADAARERRLEAARILSWCMERSETGWRWVEFPPRTARATRAWMEEIDSVEMAAVILAGIDSVVGHLEGTRLYALPLLGETDFDRFRVRFAEERRSMRSEWEELLARRHAAASAQRQGEGRSSASGGGPRRRIER